MKRRTLERYLKGMKRSSSSLTRHYDAEPILLTVTKMGAEPVIPPKSNRKVQREYNEELYKERYLVECFIGKLKHYRRCFSRFDKLARNYLSFLHFASTLIWLR